MYTILMKDDKSLITTVRATLFQREKLVDKIQFLIPYMYQDLDIRNCQIVLKYIDQGNEAHSEFLIMDEELYKENFVRCVMPVDTELTQFAGDISIHLSFLNLSTEPELHEEVMHSGDITITISPRSDLYNFVSDKSLSIIDQKMLELDAKIKAVELMTEENGCECEDGVPVVEFSEIKSDDSGEIDNVVEFYSTKPQETNNIVEF